MADDTERLFVQLEARITDFEKRMAKAERTGTKTYNSLRRGSKSATRQMEMDMARSTARINQALASTSSQIGLFAKSFAIGAVGGGVMGFATKVRSVVSELSEMQKVIDRVGLSAKVFQELEYGFGLAGVSQSEFVTGMEQFTKRIGEASMGTGRLKEILDANGVSLRKQNGEMKSTEELLRQYADLIKNARSEQEQMTLATEAFGRGGAPLVNALKNGADAFDDYADAAEDTGGTISRELIDRAAEFDDKWAASWRKFSIVAKTSIMEVIPYLEETDNFAKEILSNLPVVLLADYLFSDAPETVESVNNELQKAEEKLERLQKKAEYRMQIGADTTRIDAAIDATSAKISALRAQAAGLSEETGSAVRPGDPDAFKDLPPAKPPRKTILPGDDRDEKRRQRSRDTAAKAALREAEAVQQLIDNMAHELSLIGATDLEKAKLTALRRAGSAASDEERRQIEQLAVAYHEETKALEENKKAQNARKDAIESLFQMGGDALESIVDGSMRAEDAIKKLAVQLALAAAQAALLGTGPLAGLLGGGMFGGSGVSSIAMGAVMGGAGGLYFNGTANTGGQKGEPRGIVHGQEAVIPLPNGGKVPVLVSGGGKSAAPRVEVDVGVSVDRNGNLQGFVRRISQEASEEVTRDAIDRFDVALPDRVQEISNDPRAR